MIDPFKMDRQINKLIMDFNGKRVPTEKIGGKIDSMMKQTRELPQGHKRTYKNQLFNLKKGWKL